MFHVKHPLREVVVGSVTASARRARSGRTTRRRQLAPAGRLRTGTVHPTRHAASSRGHELRCHALSTDRDLHGASTSSCNRASRWRGVDPGRCATPTRCGRQLATVPTGDGAARPAAEPGALLPVRRTPAPTVVGVGPKSPPAWSVRPNWSVAHAPCQRCRRSAWRTGEITAVRPSTPGRLLRSRGHLTSQRAQPSISPPEPASGTRRGGLGAGEWITRDTRMDGVVCRARARGLSAELPGRCTVTHEHPGVPSPR